MKEYMAGRRAAIRKIKALVNSGMTAEQIKRVLEGERA